MAFMKVILDRGYAETVLPADQNNEIQESVWYIPHHEVYHP